MQNIIEQLKQFFTSPKMKTFYFQTINGFIVILIGYATTAQATVIDPMQVVGLSAALAILNFATKYINQNYLS